MALQVKNLTADEAVDIGEAIYQKDIRSHVEADHFGEYVAVDLESGKWAIAKSEELANDQILHIVPNSIPYVTRVGYGYIRRFGHGRVRATS